MIIGLSHDPVLGSIIMFGRGGSEVELYKDISFGVLPMTQNDILELIKKTKVYTRLKGYRNMPGADIEKIIKTIYRISLLVEDFSIIKELDINPLSASAKKVLALDAKIVLK